MNEQQLQALQSAVYRYAVTKEYLASLLHEYGYLLFTAYDSQEKKMVARRRFLPSPYTVTMRMLSNSTT